MGFSAEFDAWLTALLAGYVGANVARLAAVLEPAVVTLAVLYVMVWGYLQLMGQLEQPFIAGLKRIVLLAVVLGIGLRLWLYQPLIVDTFFAAPTQLAAAVIGAYDPVTIVDRILYAGDDAATRLIQKGGLFDGDLSYYLAGFAVYLIVGLTAVYTMFLLALSKIALSVLLALGPLFIALLLFETTQRFFEAWIAQLANYALIAILTVLVAALMLRVVTVAAEQAAATGGGIELVHAVRVCLAAGLTFLVMRQVMPIAAGLASGLALSTFGVVSAAVGWGLGRASRGAGQFARGLTDRDTSRFDAWSRKAGYYLRRGAAVGAQRLTARARENALVRRGWR
jgi:type IV secretion system protein VirB6